MWVWALPVLALGLSLFISSAAFAQQKAPRFRVVALAEAGGIHKPFVDAAMEWLNALAKQDNFAVDYIQTTDKIDDVFLSQYQLFLQLNYPPYNWTPTAQVAFMRYIEEGRGGWIGFHHATLLGEFDGYPMWKWYSDFMGSIRCRKQRRQRGHRPVHQPGKPWLYDLQQKQFLI